MPKRGERGARAHRRRATIGPTPTCWHWNWSQRSGMSTRRRGRIDRREARRTELADLTQAISIDVVPLGEERICAGLEGRTASGFRTLAETPGDLAVAVRAFDECISIFFGEEIASSTTIGERNSLSERWRRFCSRYSTTPEEEGLTLGQEIARFVAGKVLGGRWGTGAVTDVRLRALKDRLAPVVENEDPRAETKSRTGDVSNAVRPMESEGRRSPGSGTAARNKTLSGKLGVSR